MVILASGLRFRVGTCRIESGTWIELPRAKYGHDAVMAGSRLLSKVMLELGAGVEAGKAKASLARAAPVRAARRIGGIVTEDQRTIRAAN
jgi:hypothetical protein